MQLRLWVGGCGRLHGAQAGAGRSHHERRSARSDSAEGRPRAKESRVGPLLYNIPVEVSAENGAHVLDKTQRIQDGKEAKQSGVVGIGEPGADRDGVICKGKRGEALKRSFAISSPTMEKPTGPQDCNSPITPPLRDKIGIGNGCEVGYTDLLEVQPQNIT